MDLERPVTEEIVTEQTTVAELIKMGKAAYLTCKQKAKRIEELESQIRSLMHEKGRLEGGVCDNPEWKWKRDFDKIVYGQIGHYMNEVDAKESEDN